MSSKITERDYKMAILSISSKIYDNELPSKYDRELNILLRAARKQVAEKVAKSEKYGSYRCPVCDAVICRSQHYCSQCGQKFDWRK